MGSKVSSLLPMIAQAATAYFAPEFLPLVAGGSALAQGKGIGGALENAGLAFAGNEFAPVLGNAFSSAFPETASEFGIGGGANSLTDLLGQTTGGGSLTGAGTMGGDILGLTNASGLTNSSGGASTSLSRLLSSGSSGLSSSGISSGQSDLSGTGSSSSGFSPSNTLSSPALGVGVGGGSSSYSSSAGGGWNIPGGSSQLDLAAADPSLVKMQNVPGFGSAAGGAASNAATGGSSMLGGNSQLLGSLLGGATSLYENNNAQNALLNANKQAQAQIAPFVASGTAANSKLSDLLGTSGNTSGAGYGTLGAAFNPTDLASTPGYQFQLQQGQQALDRQNAARGNFLSGGAIKEGQQFSQGLADSTYQQQLQDYMAQQNQQYGMLAGQGAQGFNAANASGNQYGSSGTAQAGADINTGNTINSTLASLLTGAGKAPRLVNGQIVYG